MNISEKQLRETIIRVLARIEAEAGLFPVTKKKKIYMVCTGGWDERYLKFLRTVQTDRETVIPVLTEKLRGQEIKFTGYGCESIQYLSGEVPADLADSVTVFPVVPRDLVSKTALCISDTPQTQWITSCMEAGSRIVFLISGLSPFSGREPKAYVNRILSYYRTVLEYGIELTGEYEPKPDKKPAHEETQQVYRPAVLPVTGGISAQTGMVRKSTKKRVISSRDVEQYQKGGVLLVTEDDIITDLAKDRARFLQVKFMTEDGQQRF